MTLSRDGSIHSASDSQGPARGGESAPADADAAGARAHRCVDGV